MINVDDDIINAYKSSTTQFDKIIVDGIEFPINNVDYSDDCYNEGTVFGTAIGRALEFDIENIIDMEKKEFEYLTGILTNKGVEWISLGNFIVTDVSPGDTTNINRVSSLDYMLKSNVPYKTELDYLSGEITILDVMQEACAQAGLELATTEFANCSYIVDSNQFDSDALIRQVFQAVAGISGRCAKIKPDNKVHLISFKRKTKKYKVKEIDKMLVSILNKLIINGVTIYNDTKYIENRGDYSNLIIKRNTHPINTVILGMADIDGENITLKDEESIIGEGENSLIIADNPFAYTQQKREELIVALFEEVKGFSYTSFEITGQCKPYWETGDCIYIIDSSNTAIETFLFRYTYKSPNGLESTLEAPSITKATVNYKNVPDELNRLMKTEIIVDKQTGQISNLVSQTEGLNQNVSKLIIDKDKILSSISETTQELDKLKTRALELEQNSSSYEMRFLTFEEAIDELNKNSSEKNNELIKYIRFIDGILELGQNTNKLKVQLSNEKLSFFDGSKEVAYVSNNKLYITDAEILSSLIIGKFGFFPRKNGSLSFRKVR